MHYPRAMVTIAFALSLTGVPSAHAEITPVNYPTPLAQAGTISGDIMNIDPVNKMIQVKDATGIVQTIHVDDHVQILRRGEEVRLNNLSLGDFVSVKSK